MKFIENVSSMGRTGALLDLPKPWSSLSFKTPLCLTHARGGTIPHFTKDTFKYFKKDPIFLLHTLPTVIDFKEPVATQGKGLNTFTGIPELPFFLTVQDPGTLTPPGYNVKNGVAVWGHGGKRLIKAHEYMNLVQHFKPACYQALCDSDTPSESCTKRISRSLEQSLKFLDDCIEYREACPELSNSAIFGTVQGGMDLSMRRRSASETALRSVDGFVIDGFHTNGPDVLNLDFEVVKPLISEVLALLPADKPRLLNGAFSPEFMLQAIRCGVDIFDSSYAYVLSELGEASIFPLEKIPLYFQKNFDSMTSEGSKINLIDIKYKNDFSPILKCCECYTCLYYTKAYLNHLLVTSELLARILLMIHNLHHLYEFFDIIRKSLKASGF